MSLLFQEAKIGKMTLKNRIVMPPMCMYSCKNDGKLTNFHKYHYTSRALGDVGLIIVEASAIEPKGRISSHDVGFWDDEHIALHKELVQECHLYGAKMAIQIAHAGRKSEVEDSTPISCSSLAFSDKKPFKTPLTASLEDIKNIKKLFLDAAIRAKKANYDAVELHAAHGYLLCQFLSNLTNKRDDEYGGSLENRCKIVLEIAKEIKKEVDLPLLVRISASEWMKDGWNINDSIYLCKELEKLGVDAIHVSSGGNQLNTDDMPKIEALYQSSWAKSIKENVKIPVIAVGLITTAIEGEYLLENKYCDFVAYGRAILRNPNLVFTLANDLKQNDKIIAQYKRAY